MINQAAGWPTINNNIWTFCTVLTRWFATSTTDFLPMSLTLRLAIHSLPKLMLR